MSPVPGLSPTPSLSEPDFASVGMPWRPVPRVVLLLTEPGALNVPEGSLFRCMGRRRAGLSLCEGPSTAALNAKIASAARLVTALHSLFLGINGVCCSATWNEHEQPLGN